MSLFKPKDGDYVVRGLTLLFAWWILGTPVLIILIALLSGNANVGVLGLLLSLVLGLVGYWQYLNFGLRERRRADAKRLEVEIELRRVELQMLMKGYKW